MLLRWSTIKSVEIDKIDPRRELAGHGIPLLFLSAHETRNGLKKGIPVDSRIRKQRCGKQQAEQISHFLHGESPLVNFIQDVNSNAEFPEPMKWQAVREPWISKIYFQSLSKEIIQHIIREIQLSIQ